MSLRDVVLSRGNGAVGFASLFCLNFDVLVEISDEVGVILGQHVKAYGLLG